jgi:hypothetical protein
MKLTIVSSKPEVALGQLLKPGNDVEGGGLAAARRPEQHRELLVADLEIELVDRGDRAVPLGDLVEADPRHRLSP